MSKDSLEFLLNLLGKVTLSASDDQFEELAARIVQTKKELIEAISQYQN